jgi:hypothetical protein
MANINSTSLRNNLVQSLTMSGNLTWAKADFKGKFTVLISATGATRTLTISNTGFVAGDFICLLIDQNSAQSIDLVIGARSILGNRGNIINAIFNGINWNVWGGGGVFNTSSSDYANASTGLAVRASGGNSTAFGYASSATGFSSTSYGYASTANASQSTANGTGANATNTQATANGAGSLANGLHSTANGAFSGGNATGSTANGRSALAYGAETLAEGYNAQTNSFVRSNAIGAYAFGRRYGSTRLHLGTTTSTTDATNPSQNKEWATWNRVTTNDTITEIFLRGVASNRCVLQAKNVLKFRGQCTAFRSDYSGSAGWDITGLIKRDGSNVTTLIGVTATLTHSDGTGGTLVLTITADDTNEALKVEVTGNASETWTWLVELELLDLRIA